VFPVNFMLLRLCNWLYIDCRRVKLLVFFFLAFASFLFVALVANKAINGSKTWNYCRAAVDGHLRICQHCLHHHHSSLPLPLLRLLPLLLLLVLVLLLLLLLHPRPPPPPPPPPHLSPPPVLLHLLLRRRLRLLHL